MVAVQLGLSSWQRLLGISLLPLALLLAGCNGSSSSSSSSSSSANQESETSEVEFEAADPPQEVSGGLTFVSSDEWTEGAVRRVLHLFAFGGHASDEQINAWAAMPPAEAIAEILVVDEFHPLLSPIESADHVGSDGTLSGLSDYWSSDAASNPLREMRGHYALAGDDSWRSPARLWYQATMTRGLNPVRQKIGLYLTNYHLAVNLNANGMINHQVVRYYDDIMTAVEEGRSFDEVLTVAAASSAIAQQYNHRVATFDNGVFRGNENFAREYFQLFFGILNSSNNPSDFDGDETYHEEVTIPNMARLLTGIQLGGDAWDSPEKADVTYDQDSHHRADLEILGHQIAGNNALEKLEQLGPLAIEHPQSLHNLPVMIIRWLADDEIMDKPEMKDRLRAHWAGMDEKELMAFLRAYAISTDFHTADRVKYYSIFDRLMTVHNLLSTRNDDVFRLDYNEDNDQWNYVYNHEWDLWEQGFSVFVPYHDVFGGQTGLDAYTSTDYFRQTYNMVTQHTWRYIRNELEGPDGDVIWRKRWETALPESSNDSYYTVKELSEWLWQRFIADDLANFGPLERVYVYAFVASGQDPVPGSRQPDDRQHHDAGARSLAGQSPGSGDQLYRIDTLYVLSGGALMQRREFLKGAVSSLAGARWLAGGGALASGLVMSAPALASPQDSKLVIQLTLDGGPDFRHLFVPQPSTSSGFGKTYWAQNFRTHGLENGTYDKAMTRWDQDYVPVTLNGETFGVLKKAQWLADLLADDKSVGAALINNMVGSTSRDHVHALLALDYGRHDTLASEYGRSGWGGRLADTLGGRVASLTRTPRNLCFAPASTGSNQRAETDSMLTLGNARNAGLFDQRRQSDDERHWNAGQSRALGGYYSALQDSNTNPRMSRLLEHEQQLRSLGQSLEERLQDVAVPEAIARLSDSSSSVTLHRSDFARQIASAHDLINHSADLMGMRLISMDYHGWDSHDNQKTMIEPNFEDLFDPDRGLESLFDSMDTTARQNVVVVINGEFGRQTRSNRDAGTDHGRGNSMLVLGEKVQTGIYGELFPESEVDRMVDAVLPDIEGRTTIEHLHKALADWALGADSGSNVVNRDLGQLIRETGLDLDSLFTS